MQKLNNELFFIYQKKLCGILMSMLLVHIIRLRKFCAGILRNKIRITNDDLCGTMPDSIA